MASLFDPLGLRSVTLRNRAGMSPMCMYSCEARDGMPTDWHMAHLGARASGGCGLVICEASAVEPRGRISLQDTGIWNDTQAAAWRPIAEFIKSQGAVAGMQLAHAGRKAGTKRPWDGRGVYSDDELHDGIHNLTQLLPAGPSAVAYNTGHRIPHALESDELAAVKHAWTKAAIRSRDAGFNLLEIHMAHGYLLHQFLSPLSNARGDQYGGSLENRMRWPLEVAEAVRTVWPDDLPLAVRISATDWAPGGWDIEQSLALCAALKSIGVDLIDVSTGGLTHTQDIPRGLDGVPEPGYQVAFATRIRNEVGIPVACVGGLTTTQQASSIVQGEEADIVLLGREHLRTPYWAQQAAIQLGVEPPWPDQYGWAV